MKTKIKVNIEVSYVTDDEHYPENFSAQEMAECDLENDPVMFVELADLKIVSAEKIDLNN
jgi:hypothetical protein